MKLNYSNERTTHHYIAIFWNNGNADILNFDSRYREEITADMKKMKDNGEIISSVYFEERRADAEQMIKVMVDQGYARRSSSIDHNKQTRSSNPGIETCL